MDMQTESGEWLTVAEAAGWLRVRQSEVVAAIHAGEIPSLRIGGNFRVSRTGLLRLAEDLRSAADPARASVVAMDDRIALPAGVVWLEELQPSDAFSHGWPQKGGGTFDETYSRSWQGRIRINGSEVAVLIGETVRFERGRLTVFFDNYPVAEFMDTPDGMHWVSVIKPDGKRTVASSDSLPPLYRGVDVAPYQEATGVGGSGRPTGLAVVIDRADLHSAVHHAAARQVGKQGQLVAGPPNYYWIGVEMKAPRAIDRRRQQVMDHSIGSAYNSQMLKPSEVEWQDGRTALIFMAAGGMNSRDAERAVVEMAKRHAGVAEVASEREIEVRVINSVSFDPIAYRQLVRSQQQAGSQ
jgi:excisionase family DNA binding protein